MLFRRASRRRRSLLRKCPCCHGRLVGPLSWEPSDDAHWRIDLRCGDCDHRWQAVIDDARAARYDIELDADLAVIRRALDRFDLARMAVEADAFADALSRDLISPADFAG